MLCFAPDLSPHPASVLGYGTPGGPPGAERVDQSKSSAVADLEIPE